MRSSSGAWAFDELDDRVEQPLALAIDGEGGVHVAYGGGELRYAPREGGAWARSTIAFDRAHERMDLAVDAAGGLHLSYTGRSDGSREIRYASAPHGGASWTVESVGVSALHGVAMAMDRWGVIHAAHTPYNVRHLARDATGVWTMGDVTPRELPDVEFTYGASVDVDGAVHFAWRSFHALVHGTRCFCP
ncbi:MAG TPA: hypothetical protein VIL20_05395 [Sandaracinaceae bacterium]